MTPLLCGSGVIILEKIFMIDKRVIRAYYNSRKHWTSAQRM